MSKIAGFLRAEAVLLIAAAAAVISCIFHPPSAEYIEFIDFRVLGLLFCLMLVIAGFSEIGVMNMLAEKLAERSKNARGLVFVLMMLCFFSSMAITNDVALITFVPFGIAVLHLAGCGEYIIYAVVLQTAAANLGSVLTPLGNPQNLYLFSYFEMSASDFFSVTVPVCALSFALLLILLLPVKRKPVNVISEERFDKIHAGKLFVYMLLFSLCILTVFNVLSYIWTLYIICFIVLAMEPKLLLKVDYSLLFTFVAFFIFVGNMTHLPAVQETLSALIKGKELLSSVLLSQIVSNVPAAVLLSGFTDNALALVAGTNIGGLGTLVASLASLISFKIYAKDTGAKTARYLLQFSIVNFGLLIVLCVFAWLIY